MTSHEPAPRHFRIELGFDRQADRILGTRASDNLYPLQNALVDISEGDGKSQAKPAWYTKLQPHDTVYLRLLDITDLVLGTCDDEQEPAAPLPQEVQIATTETRDRGRRMPVLAQPAEWHVVSPVCAWSPVFSVGNQRFAGYDLYPNPDDSQPAEIRDLPAEHFLLAAELSMLITLESCPEKQFVFDPEMIVGPQSTDGF
ncbi:MAG: hypothetical protein AAF657_01970 [Acidobacteriota bacterium]